MTTTLTIERPQHIRALELANRVRIARAALKAKIAAGELTVAETLREVPWEAQTMTVGELLRAQDRWGRVRVRRFLSRVAISESRTLERMTTRQSDQLAAALSAAAR